MMTSQNNQDIFFQNIFKNVIEYYEYNEENVPDPDKNYIISFENPEAFNAKVLKEILYLKNYEFINILDEELFKFFNLDEVKGIILTRNSDDEDCILLNRESESDLYCIVDDTLLKRRIFDFHLQEKNNSLEYYNYCLTFIICPILILLAFSYFLS